MNHAYPVLSHWQHLHTTGSDPRNEDRMSSREQWDKMDPHTQWVAFEAIRSAHGVLVEDVDGLRAEVVLLRKVRDAADECCHQQPATVSRNQAEAGAWGRLYEAINATRVPEPEQTLPVV